MNVLVNLRSLVCEIDVVSVNAMLDHKIKKSKGSDQGTDDRI